MDGIGTENSDIIMLASTNRADMLDKGNLLRENDNYIYILHVSHQNYCELIHIEGGASNLRLG